MAIGLVFSIFDHSVGVTMMMVVVVVGEAAAVALVTEEEEEEKREKNDHDDDNDVAATIRISMQRTMSIIASISHTLRA